MQNPLQDLNPTGQVPTDSIWERNDAKTLYLLENVAGTAKKNQLRDLDYNLAAQGLSPDEIDQKHEQDRLAQQAQQFAMQGEGLTDSKYKKMLEGELGNMPQRQVLGDPNLNPWQAGLGALAAILDPGHAAQNVNTVLGGAVAERDRSQMMLDQDFEIKKQQRQERIGLISKIMGVEQAEAERLMKSEELRYQHEQDAKQLEQRGMEKQAQDLRDAYGRYNSANSKGEKEVAFGELNRQRQKSGLDPLGEDALSSDLFQMNAQNEKAASSEWEKALANMLNQFGEVDDSSVRDLETYRDAIAKGYRIDPARLRAIPTAKTLKAQAFAQRKAEFDQRMGFEAKKWADTLADKLANRDIAERRFLETMRHNTVTESFGSYNAQTSRLNFQVSAYNATNKAVTDGVDEALGGKNGKGGLRAELAGKRNALTRAVDKKAKEKIEGEIAELEGQISYLEATKSPDIQLPTIMGGGSVPRPDMGGGSPNLPMFAPPPPGMTGGIHGGGGVPGTDINPDKKAAPKTKRRKPRSGWSDYIEGKSKVKTKTGATFSFED